MSGATSLSSTGLLHRPRAMAGGKWQVARHRKDHHRRFCVGGHAGSPLLKGAFGHGLAAPCLAPRLGLATGRAPSLVGRAGANMPTEPMWGVTWAELAAPCCTRPARSEQRAPSLLSLAPAHARAAMQLQLELVRTCDGEGGHGPARVHGRRPAVALGAVRGAVRHAPRRVVRPHQARVGNVAHGPGWPRTGTSASALARPHLRLLKRAHRRVWGRTGALPGGLTIVPARSAWCAGVIFAAAPPHGSVALRQPLR